MSYRTEYYESVDYTWVLARQLDRIAAAYTAIDPKAPGLGLKRLLMAVRAFYMLASLFAPKEGVEALKRAEELSREARAYSALDALDDAVGRLLKVLNEKGLLLRKTDLPVGRYSGGEE